MSDVERIDAILSYMIEHNEGHGREHEKWLKAVSEFGNEEIGREIERVVELSDEITGHVRRARELLHGGEKGAGSENRSRHTAHGHGHAGEHEHGNGHRHIQFHEIGVIHTPYTADTPSNEMQVRETPCSIVLNEPFGDGLWRLESFSHIIVLFFLHGVDQAPPMTVSPPWARGVATGLFASRSPARPNPIGMSVARVRRIEGRVIHTDNVDAHDGSPLIDIKPYIETLDSRVGAGNGWIDDLDEDVKPPAFS
jgi:tRNA-Thr(GGU) m(6)t(6)A37 methyltransferase TsaA